MLTYSKLLPLSDFCSGITSSKVAAKSISAYYFWYMRALLLRFLIDGPAWAPPSKLSFILMFLLRLLTALGLKNLELMERFWLPFTLLTDGRLWRYEYFLSTVPPPPKLPSLFAFYYEPWGLATLFYIKLFVLPNYLRLLKLAVAWSIVFSGFSAFYWSLWVLARNEVWPVARTLLRLLLLFKRTYFSL